MKPFNLEDILAVDTYSLVETQDAAYIDWAFYNWGNKEQPELEPLKVTLSMDVQEKKIYATVAAVDEYGNDIDLPDGAHSWAAQQVKELATQLLQFEGVQMNDRLTNLLKGE